MIVPSIGLTNHVEVIILNAIRSGTGNRVEMIPFNLFPSVKYLLGYCGLKNDDYDIYKVVGWDINSITIQPATRNTQILRKNRFAFINKSLNLEESNITTHIKELSLPMPSRQLFKDSYLQ